MIVLKTLSYKYFIPVIFLFILSAFNFSDKMTGSWNPQYIYNTNGQSIQDMAFADSLNGYITLKGNSILEGTILKTTNGGNNWIVSYHALNNDTGLFSNIKVFNKDSCIVCGGLGLLKTTNGGLNWIYKESPITLGALYIEAFNLDTIWLAATDGFHYPYLYLSTNGGTNWSLKFNPAVNIEFNRLYFYNRRIGFCCNSSNTYKTTNGGENWFLLNNSKFWKMQFVDSLVGWKCTQNMWKTTDGGYNWTNQALPSGNQFYDSWMIAFYVLNKDTIWGCGGNLKSPPSIPKGIIWKTTNGGLNWGYQLPDTNLIKFYPKYFYISFINKRTGWVYTVDSGGGALMGGVHTITGGLDSTVYVGVNEHSTNIASGFILYQNYPNPFNPSTSIRYKVESTKQIRLVVYDILGKEITTLVNEKKKAGEYEVKFNGSNLPSGIYFYSLSADGVRVEARKMILLK